MPRKRVNLEDLVTILGNSAKAASREAGKIALEGVEEYFTKGDDGVWNPDMRTIRLRGEEIELEKVAMVDVSSMGLKELKYIVKLSVDLDEQDASVFNHRGLFKKGIDLDVEMTFQKTDLPEGIELLRDALYRKIADQLNNLK